MDQSLLSYYEALEKASTDMLDAARAGNWDHVIKLEDACLLLISQLKAAYKSNVLSAEESQLKSRIMKHIMANDAEFRALAQPYLNDPNQMPPSNQTLH